MLQFGNASDSSIICTYSSSATDSPIIVSGFSKFFGVVPMFVWYDDNASPYNLGPSPASINNLTVLPFYLNK